MLLNTMPMTALFSAAMVLPHLFRATVPQLRDTISFTSGSKIESTIFSLSADPAAALEMYTTYLPSEYTQESAARRKSSCH